MVNQVDGERFLAAFAELKSATADNPDQLEMLSQNNARLREVCVGLTNFVRHFELAEGWSTFAFTPNVSIAGAAARREYEDRWRDPIYRVVNRDFLALLDTYFEELSEADEPFGDRSDDSSLDALAIDIDEWKQDAREFSAGLTALIDEAAEREFAQTGLEAWDRLIAAGLDIEGVLWRRRALPHILVPEHVARRYGVSRASLYRRLHQAGQAFMFGAPLAALALQRAVLEETLKRHWGSESGHIRDASLPELTWEARADRLKRLANEALHRDPETLTPDQLDRAIIENFLFLRLLIEKAPLNARRKRETETR